MVPQLQFTLFWSKSTDWALKLKWIWNTQPVRIWNLHKHFKQSPARYFNLLHVSTTEATQIVLCADKKAYL